MIKFFVNLYSQRFLSSWIVFTFDIITVSGSFVLAYFIRFNFNYRLINPFELQIQLGLISLIYLLSFLLSKPYIGIIRHTGLSDAFRILKAISLPLGLLIIANILFTSLGNFDLYVIPYSILIIHFLLSLFLLVGSRVIVKLTFLQISRQYTKKRIAVIIYGAGDAGMLTKNALIKDVSFHYEIVSYIDDNRSKINKSIEGIPVISQKQALRASYIKQHNIKQLIIAIQGLHPEKKKAIIEAGLDLDLQIKVVPAISLWTDGQLSSQQLRNVKIEELLERDVIELDSKNIDRELKNKVVMVTGAAGSIGCEIARQIINYRPKRLIILDQAESPIFDLQFEINNTEAFRDYRKRIEFVVANVKEGTSTSTSPNYRITIHDRNLFFISSYCV